MFMYIYIYIYTEYPNEKFPFRLFHDRLILAKNVKRQFYFQGDV